MLVSFRPGPDSCCMNTRSSRWWGSCSELASPATRDVNSFPEAWIAGSREWAWRSGSQRGMWVVDAGREMGREAIETPILRVCCCPPNMAGMMMMEAHYPRGGIGHVDTQRRGFKAGSVAMIHARKAPHEWASFASFLVGASQGHRRTNTGADASGVGSERRLEEGVHEPISAAFLSSAMFAVVGAVATG
jgi:hypothetical protein